LENTIGVIRSHNGKDRLTTEIEKDKKTNTDGQNNIQLTKIYFKNPHRYLNSISNKGRGLIALLG
jgi:hypothetical protein